MLDILASKLKSKTVPFLKNSVLKTLGEEAGIQ